jgi:hypothetical protein
MRLARVGAVVFALTCALVLTGCAISTPDPASITAAQRKSATAADLALRWSQVEPGDPAYPRPKVAIVKYGNYLTEGPLLEACMRKSGYPHTTWSLSYGLYDTDHKPVNRFPVEVATYVCEAKYPEEPLELGYLSDAQEVYLYSYWANETVPCLRAHGAVVKNLPPVGLFGEGYEDVGALNPFASAKFRKGTPEALYVAECPPYPGQLYTK